MSSMTIKNLKVRSSKWNFPSPWKRIPNREGILIDIIYESNSSICISPQGRIIKWNLASLRIKCNKNWALSDICANDQVLFGWLKVCSLYHVFAHLIKHKISEANIQCWLWHQIPLMLWNFSHLLKPNEEYHMVLTH